MTTDARTHLGADPVTRDSTVRRFILVALVLPTVLAVAGAVTLLALASSLPDPVAIHWGPSGAPDGFGPVWLPALLLLILGVALPVLLAATTLPALRRDDRGATSRFLGAISLGLAAFLTVLITVSTVRQIGVSDAAAGPTIWWALAAAAAVGAVAGIGGWFLQPHRPFLPSAPASAAPTDLAPGERAAWLQRVTIARSGLLVLGGAITLIAALTVVTWLLSAEPVAQWIMVGATLLLLAIVVTTTVFHVRVDDEGLTVASAVGWPRVHVPLADVERASAVSVNPMGEFGGWGLRWGPGGRFGVVLRTGEGIEVRRRTGKAFTVTVDDAETGASLLTALASRR